MTEKWLPIPGYEDCYEASDQGQVRRIGRRILKQRKLFGKNYLVVTMSRKGKYRDNLVHRMVLLAFRGVPRPDQEARHLNGKHDDNRLSNLAWGTHQENCQDQKWHGTHPNTVKTHCPREHEYTETNTIYGSHGERKCRECKRISDAAAYQKRKYREHKEIQG